MAPNSTSFTRSLSTTCSTPASPSDGQHALDVAQEDPVRADDEHALVFEREAERVEEIGGPVEGDHGLARAGPALHDEHAGLRASG